MVGVPWSKVRARVVVVVGIALLAGCRFGAYGGSIRGRGAATMPPATPGSVDTSFTLSTYEATSDVVRGPWMVLTDFGGGSLNVRSRTMPPTGAPALADQGHSLDLYAGIGGGYQILTGRTHVAIYGLYTYSLFSDDLSSSLPNRFTLGVELGYGGSARDTFGLSARLGYTHASGTYTTEDQALNEQPGADLACDAILFQLGGWVAVRL